MTNENGDTVWDTSTLMRKALTITRTIVLTVVSENRDMVVSESKIRITAVVPGTQGYDILQVSQLGV